MIHPTAVIHPKAQIGANCHIGPFCTIGEHVVLGDECHLHSHVVIDGRYEVLGSNYEQMLANATEVLQLAQKKE